MTSRSLSSSSKRSASSSLNSRSTSRSVSRKTFMGSSFFPVQDHLAAVAGAHHVEAALELGVGETVGDHRADVEPRLEHYRHLVPCLIHFASVNTLEGQHVEDDHVPVDGHLL